MLSNWIAALDIFTPLRRWWQQTTGEAETPFDGDSPAWFWSFIINVSVLLAMCFITSMNRSELPEVALVAPVEEKLPEPEVIEQQLPEKFAVSDLPSDKVGANSENGSEMALSQAPLVSENPDAPTPELEETVSDNKVPQLVSTHVAVPTGLTQSNLSVKGSVGQGTTGAGGAIDRITQEVLNSLEERKTLVIWLFDQSGSLNRQRAQIHDRFDRIYEELGVIEAAGNKAFKKHDDRPLLSTVFAFGNQGSFRLKEPTDSLPDIKAAVAGIEQDTTGVERTFSAVYTVVEKYKNLRMPDEKTGQPKRNVMVVVFTDEIGDDQNGLDETTRLCRRYEVPVYVVGVPAPFGRKDLMVKWVDPDPKFDQTPQWGQVDQGPETIMPEVVRLSFSGSRDEEDPIDSGFGPYALTRLCWETGGIYFAVHPNRNVNKAVSRNDTAEFSAYMKYFFDPNVMRRYRPDYVSLDEYKRRVSSLKSRMALVEASTRAWTSQMETPRMTFTKRDEGDFSNILTEAQKDAAKVEPQLNMLYDVLKLGEGDRSKETIPRWQAGYDLAMGRVMAAKARAEAYNAMLSEAKRGYKFKDKNNTLDIKPSDKITVGSQLEKIGQQARVYLQRVIDEHPDTPWAMLAKRELELPIGWEFTERMVDVNPPRANNNNNNNNNAAANDALKMLPKGPEKRPVPKL